MKVGFAGLGRMGTPMAENVARAGFDLTLWNRGSSKAAGVAAETSAQVAGTPRQLAESTDVVISMLADDDASAQVHLEEDGLFAACHGASTFISMGLSARTTSTGSATSQANARSLTRRCQGR
jgi:3-hydroxyisobutyrate dehydrogenase